MTVAFIAVIGLRNLPPGVCLDDAGDLQCASATLGIAHPPGYVGDAAVGWVLCRVLPFVQPAYVVSLACLSRMVLAIVLLSLLLIRAGLHTLLAAGTWCLTRESPEAAWIAWGIVLGNLLVALQYRVHGQAADTLPLLFASVWLIGAGLARVVPRSDARARSPAVWRRVVALVVFLAVATWAVYHAQTRCDYARHRDATAFLEGTNFEALPKNSVVFADWQRSRPLWYARSVSFDRMDVRIMTTRGEIAAKLWPEIADRPVFCTSPRGAPEGYHFVRQGMLWRLVPNE